MAVRILTLFLIYLINQLFPSVASRRLLADGPTEKTPPKHSNVPNRKRNLEGDFARHDVSPAHFWLTKRNKEKGKKLDFSDPATWTEKESGEECVDNVSDDRMSVRASDDESAESKLHRLALLGQYLDHGFITKHPNNYLAEWSHDAGIERIEIWIPEKPTTEIMYAKTWSSDQDGKMPIEMHQIMQNKEINFNELSDLMNQQKWKRTEHKRVPCPAMEKLNEERLKDGWYNPKKGIRMRQLRSNRAFQKAYHLTAPCYHHYTFERVN